MINVAFALLVVAAVGGLIMAGRIFNGDHPPWALSLGHGALALGAVGLLAVTVAGGGMRQRVLVALLLFGAAAVGGLTMAVMHARGQATPPAFAAGHGLVALLGLVFALVLRRIAVEAPRAAPAG